MIFKLSVDILFKRDSPLYALLDRCVNSDDEVVIPMHPYSDQPHQYNASFCIHILPYLHRENELIWSLNIEESRFHETLFAFLDFISLEVVSFVGEYDSDYRHGAFDVWCIGDVFNFIDEDFA